MFAKLLKYEWRSTKGFAWLMFLISLSAAVVGGLTTQYLFRISQSQDQQPVLTVLVLLMFMAAMVALLICAAATLFFTFWRFYRSRFTQEGYLTFTLPVTSHQILLSSIVNCLLGALCALGTLLVSYLLMGLITLSAMPGFFAARWEILEALFKGASWLFTGENAPLFWQMLSQLLLGAVFEIPVIMLAITLGALLAKKHKAILGVVAYYIIQVAQLLITGVVMGVTTNSITQAASYRVTLAFDFSPLLSIAVGVGSYFLMHYLVSRKLNLA